MARGRSDEVNAKPARTNIKNRPDDVEWLSRLGPSLTVGGSRLGCSPRGVETEKHEERESDSNDSQGIFSARGVDEAVPTTGFRCPDQASTRAHCFAAHCCRVMTHRKPR